MPIAEGFSVMPEADRLGILARLDAIERSQQEILMRLTLLIDSLAEDGSEQEEEIREDLDGNRFEPDQGGGDTLDD